MTQHNHIGLEYFYPGGHRLPVAERIDNCSSHIISVLDEVYKQALTEAAAKPPPPLSSNPA